MTYPQVELPPLKHRHVKLRVHFATDPDGAARNLWHVGQNHGGLEVDCEPGEVCTRCWKRVDSVASRRNRNNRERGNRAELAIARTLGGVKVGPLGRAWDVEIPGYMRLQVKKLLRWPSLAKVAALLDAIPPGQDMRGAVLVQPGRNGRRLIVLDLDEFARWHGDPTRGERT